MRVQLKLILLLAFVLSLICVVSLANRPLFAEAAQNGSNSRGVISDVETLRSVLVLSIGDNIFKSSELGSARHPFFWGGLPRGTIREHRRMVEILKQQGVEVLDVRDLLDNAISNARRAGALEGAANHVVYRAGFAARAKLELFA